ncbi:hypothetical protein TDIS_2118 [Thermosulfurimonas dismutans]|uniref:Uncharacterized protein n=1 Tax=Thermosulfurimonas dismutans TaxID=999894 RepID=A0A179D1C1_9BACT|nr:hypothetical protein TDIS_2118 [Thermosulfurimonas dismutans]
MTSGRRTTQDFYTTEGPAAKKRLLPLPMNSQNWYKSL